jgi:hypothetical protein
LAAVESKPVEAVSNPASNEDLANLKKETEE